MQHVEAAVGERDLLPAPAAALEFGQQSRQRTQLARAGERGRPRDGAWSRSVRISSRVTVATPIFSTSSPPATLASRIAGVVVGPGGQGQAERRSSPCRRRR